MIAGHLQEKKGNYYMVLNFVDENGKRKPKWIPTGLPVKGNKRRAEAMLLEERRKYASSETYVRASADMLFADYMLYWLRQVKHQVEVTSYYGYRSNVEKRIVPYFRKRKITLAGLRSSDIQEFYSYCLETLGIGNNTVIHYHANISAALNLAVRMDMIPMSPLKKGLRPQKTAYIARFYTLEETERLFEIVRGDSVEFPVLMAAFYGLRREEIMGLKWQAIDFVGNTITIGHTVVQTRDVDGKEMIVAKDRAKNKSSYRTLPLVPQFRELLLRMKEHQNNCKELCGRSYHQCDYVYVNDIGQPYKPNYVTQHFALVLKKNNLRKITFHELRHTCASLLLKSKVPMKDIQAWLGHSDFNTTANIYAHLDSNSKHETSAAMSGNLDISGALAGMESRIARKNSGENCV